MLAMQLSEICATYKRVKARFRKFGLKMGSDFKADGLVYRSTQVYTVIEITTPKTCLKITVQILSSVKNRDMYGIVAEWNRCTPMSQSGFRNIRCWCFIFFLFVCFFQSNFYMPAKISLTSSGDISFQCDNLVVVDQLLWNFDKFLLTTKGSKFEINCNTIF